jgi:peptidoglycan lytic transglycosylase
VISRHQLTAVVFLVASALPAHLDSGAVRAVYDRARLIAISFGFSGRANTNELGYYLGLEVSQEQRARGIGELRRAIALAEEQQLDAALESYDRAAEQLPNLGDWLNVFAASVAASQGDTAQVTRRLSTLDSTLFTDWAWRARVRAYRNADDVEGAARLAEAAGELSGNLRRRSEAWRALGEVRLQAGDAAGAARAFTMAIDVWPNSDGALEAARLLGEIRGLHPQHHLRIGRSYLAFRNFKRANQSLDIYLNAASTPSDSAARVRFEIGRAYFNAKDYDKAEELLLRAASTNSPVAASALYLAGRAQYRDGEAENGRRTLLELIDRHPDQLASAQALLLLADLNQDDAQLEPAQTYFRRVTEIAPTSEPAGLAHMRLSAMAFSRADYASAATQLEHYLEAFPEGTRHQQAQYWMGRTKLARGDGDARDRLRNARDLDPYSFYGLRAAELIAEFVARDRLQPGPTTPREVAQAVAAALIRVDLLRSVGWTDAAAFELERVRSYFNEDPLALYALGEGLIQRNQTIPGISVGRELQRRAGGVWNRRLLQIVYPMPYRDLIVKYARPHGINPFFIAALIRQESMFNPSATSAVGARGLMQVMPTTGRRVARRLGIPGFRTAMLYTPETNIRIGSRFLADQIETWGGRADFVLAAYNAGPSRVDRWRTFPEANDRDLFMERIPFDETREYVRIVQLNARIYQTLYGS